VPEPTPARNNEPRSLAQPVTFASEPVDVAETTCPRCRAGVFGRTDADEAIACPECGQNYFPHRGRERSWILPRFVGALYDCICHPDPCYEPQWKALADAGFFVTAARPHSHQRLRWDAGYGLIQPDRAEYFWARADGSGRGPRPPAGQRAETALDYHELVWSIETATDRVGAVFEVPYRSLEGDTTGHAAGFSDMKVGAKTLLFDCELLQIATQFLTYIPVGASTKGLGAGHVSLEPSLLLTLKLASEAYFQGQVAEWIPLGGDPSYSGALLHYHTGVNFLLWEMARDVELIGTIELSGWSFQDGLYTDPVAGSRKGSGTTYLQLGPGVRLVICERIDFGLGAGFAVTQPHGPEQLYRSELRIHY
jgi:hypothetical protein